MIKFGWIIDCNSSCAQLLATWIACGIQTVTEDPKFAVYWCHLQKYGYCEIRPTNYVAVDIRGPILIV